MPPLSRLGRDPEVLSAGLRYATEYYVIGPGSKAEHERLRKTRPSYMDTYDLLSFEDDVDPDDGILVHVRRVSDKKKFLLPLANLEVTQKKLPNYQLLDDYAVWFVNWR